MKGLRAERGILERFFPALSPRVFFKEHLFKSPCVGHGGARRLGGRLDGLSSLRGLLESGVSAANIFCQPQGAYSVVNIGAARARELHEGRRAIITVDRVEERLPVLARWLRFLERALATPVKRRHAAALFSRRGMLNTAHFDAEDTFVIQVKGSKLWRLAPNRHCIAPLNGYSMGTEPCASLRRQARRLPLPATMPARCRSVTLRPGSVLYVPRGYWHETRALSDSISLSLWFSLATWSDLLGQAARGALEAQEPWRQTAQRLLGTYEEHRKASKRFKALRRRLAPRMTSLPLPSDSSRFWPSPGALRAWRQAPHWTFDEMTKRIAP